MQWYMDSGCEIATQATVGASGFISLVIIVREKIVSSEVLQEPPGNEMLIILLDQWLVEMHRQRLLAEYTATSFRAPIVLRSSDEYAVVHHLADHRWLRTPLTWLHLKLEACQDSAIGAVSRQR